MYLLPLSRLAPLFVFILIVIAQQQQPLANPSGATNPSTGPNNQSTGPNNPTTGPTTPPTGPTSNNNNNNNSARPNTTGNPTTTNNDSPNKSGTISDNGLGDGSPVQTGDGVITEVENPFARPKFLWPMEPGLQQQQAWWRIPVIARGSTNHPLNASWTFEGLDNKPGRLVLQVGRRSEPKNWINITDISSSDTKYTWVIPATGFPEGRDYRLRIIDPDLPAPGQLPNFRPLESGIFYVYTPMDMIVASSLPFPPASTAPISFTHTSSLSIIMAIIISLFILLA